VDFRNTVIIMTSNIGARLITEPKQLGFAPVAQDKKKSYEDMKNNVMNELKKNFRPEFLNRIDEIIVFHPLEEEHLKQIVGLMIDNLAERLKQNSIEIEVSDEAKALLAKKGFDPVYGARPLRRAVQSMVEDRLAEEMLEGRVKSGDKVFVDVKDDELVLSKTKASLFQTRAKRKRVRGRNSFGSFFIAFLCLLSLCLFKIGYAYFP